MQQPDKPVCAVFDKKVGLFDPPFVVRHTNEALREWFIVRTDKQTKFGKNPEDFDLYQIGSFNEGTGTYKNLPVHTHLASGV